MNALRALPPAGARSLLRKTKELLLDIFQSPRLETMRCRQTADAAFLPQFSGQQLQLLKGPVGTMENTRFTAIFLRAVSRIQRQRDMDMVRLLQHPEYRNDHPVALFPDLDAARAWLAQAGQGWR